MKMYTYNTNIAPVEEWLLTAKTVHNQKQYSCRKTQPWWL